MAANVGSESARGVFGNALLPQHAAMTRRWTPLPQQGLRCWLTSAAASCSLSTSPWFSVCRDRAAIIPFSHGHVGPVVAWVRSNDVQDGSDPNIENEMEPMGLIDSTKMALGEVKSHAGGHQEFPNAFLLHAGLFLLHRRHQHLRRRPALAGVFGTRRSRPDHGRFDFDHSHHSISWPLQRPSPPQNWRRNGARRAPCSFPLRAAGAWRSSVRFPSPRSNSRSARNYRHLQRTWTGTDDVYEVAAREGVNPTSQRSPTTMNNRNGRRR